MQPRQLRGSDPNSIVRCRVFREIQLDGITSNIGIRARCRPLAYDGFTVQTKVVQGYI
jgi:hypothetical protein